MKKILISLICFSFSFQAVASDLTNYIYAKAMMGDVNGLRWLSEKGYSLNAKDEDGNTAYCLAVFRRNQTAINTLEQAGADIKPRCLRSVPVVTEAMIYEAAHNRNVKQITLWQEYGVPVDLVDTRTGNTALCEAVYEKDCMAIDILLKAGASEYHTCMRRIPQKVRQELDCKPVIIDWERVGLTALGLGLVGGGVAVALSGGGGGGGKSCAINQHWDGDKCVTCPAMQCWDGNSCRVVKKGEFIDPETNRCMMIAPPPYTDGTYSASSFETDEYKKGGFLGAINASAAYARGYTGYKVSRTDIFGKLKNGQSSVPGKAKDITSNSVVVGVLSTGTEIENTTKTTTNSTTGVSTTEIVRYVNKDLASEIMEEKEVTDSSTGGTTTQLVGTGKWEGNLVTNTSGKLFGYNFDYGYIKPIKESSGGTPVYKGSQDWTAATIEGKTILTPTPDYKDVIATIDSTSNSYYSGSKHYFFGGETDDKEQIYLVLHGGDCSASSGFCGITIESSSVLSYKLVDLKDCGVNGTLCLAPPTNINDYMYSTVLGENVTYTYNVNNPAPHYYLKDRQSTSWNKGTFLAGIIAAMKNDKGMHGVAYDAKVLPAVADIFRPITYRAVETLVNAGSNILLQDIVRVSAEGEPTAAYVKDKSMTDVFGENAASAYTYAANSGIIFVVGTGTEGKNTITSGKVSYDSTVKDYQKDAGVSAGVALASDASALSKLFLSVAAVQENTEAASYGGYTLTTYSQPCGSTAKYCLSAPGGTGIPGTEESNGNLYSTISTTTADDDYNWAEGYGTSEAAAVVAGTAAVLKGAYPHLTSQEIVSLMKQTATPLGACAGATSDIDSCTVATDASGNEIGKYSTLYGWGLVNLDAATKPVGALWVHNGNSASVAPFIGTYGISTSSLTTSSVMSQSLLNALPTTFTAFDSYNRPFAVKSGSMISSHKMRKKFDDDFKAFMHGRDVTRVEANDQFSMTYAPRTSDRSSVMKTGLMEMNVNVDKTNFGFYYTEDTLNSRGNYFERALNNPFVQIQEAYGAELKHNLTSKMSVGMGFATGKNGFLGDGDKHYKAPDNRISMIETKAEYQVTKSIMFKASFGVMKEQDSVLGMMGTGAFKTAGATTNFAQAGVEVKPTDKFKLNLAYTYGWTTPEKTNGLMNMSRLAADGFAAMAQYDLGSDNMLGLSISSPLRVRSGKVSFDLPVGRSATDDTIYRETFTGSMKPTARELDFALFYRDALTDALTIQSELGMRLHPDHKKDADTDYRAMFGLKWDY